MSKRAREIEILNFSVDLIGPYVQKRREQERTYKMGHKTSGNVSKRLPHSMTDKQREEHTGPEPEQRKKPRHKQNEKGGADG